MQEEAEPEHPQLPAIVMEFWCLEVMKPKKSYVNDLERRLRFEMNIDLEKKKKREELGGGGINPIIYMTVARFVRPGEYRAGLHAVAAPPLRALCRSVSWGFHRAPGHSLQLPGWVSPLPSGEAMIRAAMAAKRALQHRWCAVWLVHGDERWATGSCSCTCAGVTCRPPPLPRRDYRCERVFS